MESISNILLNQTLDLECTLYIYIYIYVDDIPIQKLQVEYM